LLLVLLFRSVDDSFIFCFYIWLNCDYFSVLFYFCHYFFPRISRQLSEPSCTVYALLHDVSGLRFRRAQSATFFVSIKAQTTTEIYRLPF